MSAQPSPQSVQEKVMRLCRHCAAIARERREERKAHSEPGFLQESDTLKVKTGEGDAPLTHLSYDFAVHLTKLGVGWGKCDACPRRQWPNRGGPLHEGDCAPLVYFAGEPKDIKRLYSIAARVMVGGEMKPFIESVMALTQADAIRQWRQQFAGAANYKHHVIDAVGPTLGFYVNDKDGKDVSTS
jgi:hypothetical protein